MVCQAVHTYYGVLIMSANLYCIDFDKSYSYQHLHGLMLVELNKLSQEINLTHTQYRLMGVLIGLWNKELNKAFPTIDYLAKSCRMSKSTILKSITTLKEKNLILVVKQTKNKRNNYFLNTNLFLKKISTIRKPSNSTPCETTHDIKLIKIKTNKKRSLKNNDDINYQIIKNTLKKWHVINYQQIITHNKPAYLIELIEKVIKYNPQNPGAYFRILLSNSTNEVKVINKENLVLKRLLKTKYWKHIPSGEIIKIKPDVGNHLLFRYNKETNKVSFLENPLTDTLSQFESIENAEHSLEKQINTKKPSKELILKDLIMQGDFKQAECLAKIWKIKLMI